MHYVQHPCPLDSFHIVVTANFSKCFAAEEVTECSLMSEGGVDDHKKYAESVIEVVFNQRKPVLLKEDSGIFDPSSSSSGNNMETFKSASTGDASPKGIYLCNRSKSSNLKIMNE